MRRYEVFVPYTGHHVYHVEAENDDDAIAQVESGDHEPHDQGDIDANCDTNTWIVQEY